jgi:hypothetical protein
MDLNNLFELIIKYEAANFTLWNIYILVVVALLGFSIGSERVKNTSTRVILAVSFIAFTIGNSNYLERNNVLIKATSTEISQVVKVKVENYEKLSPNFQKEISKWAKLQPSSLKPIHYIIDTFVVLLVLLGHRLASKGRHVAS